MTKARDNAAGSGLVLLNTTSFTSASTLSLQSVFTDSYENYRLQLNIDGISGTSRYMNWQLMSGATVQTALEYYWGYQGVRYGTVTTQSTNGGETSALAVLYGGNNATGVYMNIFNPKKNQTTTVHGGQTGHDGGNISYMDFGWYHANTGSYDGIKLWFSVAASGTVRLYGYK